MTMSAKKLRKQHEKVFFEVITPYWFGTGYGDPVPRTAWTFKRLGRSAIYEYIHVSISAERVFIS